MDERFATKKVRNIYRKIEKVDEVAGKFTLSMVIYSSNIIKAMDILDNADADFRKGKMLYQHNLMYMRMLIDCCTELQAVLLIDKKERYYNNYFAGNETNRLKIGKQALTRAFLIEELDKVFEGIKEIYKECCSWIHPSKASIVRVARFRKRREEYIGYRGRTYTKMGKEKKDILKDFDYCVDVLYTLLSTLKLYYLRPDIAAKTEETQIIGVWGEIL